MWQWQKRGVEDPGTVLAQDRQGPGPSAVGAMGAMGADETPVQAVSRYAVRELYAAPDLLRLWTSIKVKKNSLL